jgi:hypothetical protein
VTRSSQPIEDQQCHLKPVEGDLSDGDSGQILRDGHCDAGVERGGQSGADQEPDEIARAVSSHPGTRSGVSKFSPRSLPFHIFLLVVAKSVATNEMREGEHR